MTGGTFVQNVALKTDVNLYKNNLVECQSCVAQKCRWPSKLRFSGPSLEGFYIMQ